MGFEPSPDLSGDVSVCVVGPARLGDLDPAVLALLALLPAVSQGGADRPLCPEDLGLIRLYMKALEPLV